MHIREGEHSSLVLSDDAYLDVQVVDAGRAYRSTRLVHLSELRKPGKIMKVRSSGNGNGPDIRVDYLEHAGNARPTLKSTPGGAPSIVLVSSSPSGRVYHAFHGREQHWIGEELFRFFPAGPDRPLTADAGGASAEEGVTIRMQGDSLWFRAAFPVSKMDMGRGTTSVLEAQEWHPFDARVVYGFRSQNIVLSEKDASADVLAITQGEESGTGRTALSLRLSSGKDTREITVWGGKGMPGETKQFSLGNRDLLVSFGSVVRTLPFSLALEDFILEKYPGSESPASYESKVILTDPENNLKLPYRIYMNHILNYRGYRFYQSSYDTDEMGTVLSVNHDRPGTLMSYAGYLLLGLGVFLSLFNPKSRFRSLGRQVSVSGVTKAVPAILLLGLLEAVSVHRLNAAPDYGTAAIPADQASKFGKLLVQDPDGRVKPMNTLSSEVLRKVSRKMSLEGMGPDQVILGMLVDPVHWQQVPMIKISHPAIAELLGIKGKYASFLDFLDPGTENGYRILEQVRRAHRKKSADRSKFDNEILRVDERMNICYMVFTGDILRILPDAGDPNHKWHSPATIGRFYSGEDSLFAVNITNLYLQSVRDGVNSGDWSKADEYLGYIKVFQDRMGSAIMPSGIKQKAEILYNRLNLFDRLANYYLLIGTALLILLLIQTLGKTTRFQVIRRVLVALLQAGFAVQALGLALRWYVSGHAPWSNGYEALVYISWASMLAGVIFSRKMAAPIAVTAVLSWMILYTAHMSWMDPQLTNLVPVLKSYWLMIHVAVIASSYGFMGLAALLGFFNLIMMSIHSPSNRQQVQSTIGSLTAIMEMTMIAGLGLLSIGTFLGGVWANESWGRYWGWDPKESWALITILVYAFIVHMRFIPGLRGIYPFNLAAVLGYSSVVMTYFGVNYYLSGMHSYAAGDPVPVPRFVYWTVAVILTVALTAWLRYRNMQKTTS